MCGVPMSPGESCLKCNFRTPLDCMTYALPRPPVTFDSIMATIRELAPSIEEARQRHRDLEYTAAYGAFKHYEARCKALENENAALRASLRRSQR